MFIPFTFRPNPKALENMVEEALQRSVRRLRERPDKTFKLSIDGVEYTLSYSIEDSGQVAIFIENTDIPDNLTTPLLKLNLGQLLLPEALSLKTGKIVPFEQNFIEARKMGDKSLTSNELDKIRQKIEQVGLNKILSI